MPTKRGGRVFKKEIRNELGRIMYYCLKRGKKHDKMAYICHQAVLNCREAVLNCREVVLNCREAVLNCREAVLNCRQVVLNCHQTVLNCHGAVLNCRQVMLKGGQVGLNDGAMEGKGEGKRKYIYKVVARHQKTGTKNHGKNVF